MKTRNHSALVAVVVALAAALVSAQAQDPKAQAPDVKASLTTNFVRVDPNFATGGATSAEQLEAVRKLGFRTVINLRMASEPGADLEGEAAAAAKLGFQYLSLPFSADAPDPAVVDKFLNVIRSAEQPVYIHCRSGVRANALWLIKRVTIDGWTTEKAVAEADALKMTNQKLRDFALAYVKDHQK